MQVGWRNGTQHSQEFVGLRYRYTQPTILLTELNSLKSDNRIKSICSDRKTTQSLHPLVSLVPQITA
ncbi:hypothetical protein [Nostoc sp. FACHB-190]|uniref:hypothetical protein n=1 Tax=Nostoc sp. FACHB-190 TaxID=2692838 RepID=UPI00168593E6|nr:hypothetical protein [Nostoc sp. FACHB-190]